MQKLVYKFDGTPTIINENVEYAFDYTETPPPEGIYSPFYFNGNEWIGATREEWLGSLPEQETIPPSPSELMMADTQMQVAESSFQLRDTQKQLAQNLLDGAEKDKRIETLEEQQARILLELAELKGEN